MPARVELPKHPARTRTTVHGWTAVLTGLLPLAMGGGAVALGLGWTPVSEARHPVVIVFGLTFLVAGVLFVLHGLDGLRRRARREAAAREHPREPWRHDHPWDPAGTPDEGADAPGGVMLAVFLTLFLGPLNWLGWSGEAPVPKPADWVLWIVLVPLDLGLLAAWGWAGLQVLRRLRHAGGCLGFDAFPFFLGQPVKVRFRPPAGLTDLSRLDFVLRCVEEAYETRGTHDEPSVTIVCYERHREEAVFEQPGSLSAYAAGIPLVFEIPADAPATALSAVPPTYWELEVRAERPGLDYRGRFLLPVYARPG